MRGTEMSLGVERNALPNHIGTQSSIQAITILLNILLDIAVCMYYSTLSVLIVEMICIPITLLCARKIENVSIGHLFLIKILMIVYAIIQCNGYTEMYGSLYYNGGSDDLNYEHFASAMIDRNLYWPWEFSEIQEVSNYSGFVVIVAWVMRIVELFDTYHPFAFIILNISIWMLSSLTVLKYLNLHHGIKRTNATAAMLLLAFPNAVYITTHVFRDTLCAYLLIVGFTIIDRDNKGRFKFIWLLIVGLALYYIRMEGALMLVCILFFSLIRDKTVGIKKVIKTIIVCALLFAMAYLSGILQYSTDKFERYVEYKSTTENAIINNIYGMPLLPIGWLARVMYGFISPLPTGLFEIGNIFVSYYSLRDFLISIGMIGEILCLPFLFKRITRLDYVALSFLVVYLSNRLVTSGFRHIILAYPFMCILIYEQLINTSRSNRKSTFLISGMLLCALGVVYVVLF